jgi:hypothetical protein
VVGLARALAQRWPFGMKSKQEFLATDARRLTQIRLVPQMRDRLALVRSPESYLCASACICG